ncbi:AglZ/HisF2 family acetamidino modification protein [Roseivirga sp. E12]|uniref:AglZ/HisF2 family acetamidino modification protein n=1 Tax=Roseivirga sp. E12 TaxID=2819237 RepID=UPI001ABC9190|nr:AglZ/HisF2 family acetamidino modification protein [Roseivirga sp. E12]MBO3699757.1 imidazole glycerol phosphate synthase subunit HisF [Roseivirga sp. E12]
MLRVRVIPCLQLLNENLVKTVCFKKPGYIGDFINTARIFNELEVDEMCVLGIRNTKQNRAPDFQVLQHLANECFMPLSYGGGINSFEMGKEILAMGYEKLVVNSHNFQDLKLIERLAGHFGRQSVVVSIDVKKNWRGKQLVYSESGQRKTTLTAEKWAMELESAGAGEILLTSIDAEGTWEGFDVELTRNVTKSVSIPVIAHGGAGNIDHVREVVKKGGASAVALGSMVVYQKKDMGVLVNFPDRQELLNALST